MRYKQVDRLVHAVIEINRLRAENADLRKRLRLARAELHSNGDNWPSNGAVWRAMGLLDLREKQKGRR
jgi:hypothetical protein